MQTFHGTLCVLIQLDHKLDKQDAVYENEKVIFAVPVFYMTNLNYLLVFRY
jgi:hypothetical protein